MTKKIILHIIDHIGGEHAESFVNKLYVSRKRIPDFRLVFYSLRKCKNDPEQNIDLVISKSKFRYDFHTFFELKKYIQNNKIDIIHLYLKKAVVFGILLKLIYFKHIKIIIHEHGPIFENKWWYSKFLRLFQKKINLFLAVSNATKEKLIKNAKINPHKIKILYNFVDINKFNPNKYNKINEQKKLGLYHDDFIIGFIGRLVNIKNIDKIIEAIPSITQELPRIKFVIVGDGPEKKKLQNLVNNSKLTEHVKFLGFRMDIPKIISTFDIGILVSDYENLSMYLLELVAMHKPIIATNVGGNPEIINDKIGRLINKATPQLIMGAIRDLQKTEKRNRGFDEIKKKFTLPLFIQRLEKIYSDLDSKIQ